MTSLPETKLGKAQLADRLLRECGNYDNSVIGVIGEVYSVETLGASIAPKGQVGFDCWLNGRRLSVKTKVSGAHSDAGTYVTISDKARKHVDDLIVIFVAETGVIDRVVGPLPLESVSARPHKSGPRYVISDLVKAMEANKNGKDGV